MLNSTSQRPGRRQQGDRLDEQGEQLHSRAEDQEDGPAGVGQERLGQHAGPAGVAGQGVARLGRCPRAGRRAGPAAPRAGFAARPPRPTRRNPGWLSSQAGPPSGRSSGVQHDVMGILVGPTRVVEPRRPDPREDVDRPGPRPVSRTWA